MSDKFVFLLCGGIILVSILFVVAQSIGFNNTKLLPGKVKEELIAAQRRQYDFTQKEMMVQKNWKRAKINCILMVCIFVLFFLIPGLVGMQGKGRIMWIWAFIAICLIVIGLILWMTYWENRKMSDTSNMYIVKGYIRGVQKSRSSEKVYVAYYDGNKDKIVVQSRYTSADERQAQHIRKDNYVDVVVQDTGKQWKMFCLKY